MPPISPVTPERENTLEKECKIISDVFTNRLQERNFKFDEKI